jgi:hypothetical protein
MQSNLLSSEWQRAKTRHCQRTEITSLPMSNPKRVSGAAHKAFIKCLVGHYFRCLAFDHHVAQCRDLVRCLTCKGIGHISHSCPARRPHTTPPSSTPSVRFPRESVHSHISFPLCTTTTPSVPPPSPGWSLSLDMPISASRGVVSPSSLLRP